jgi:hypothetical protein
MAQDFGGVADAYKPPAADYEVQETRGTATAHYVVSVTKLIILFLGTFGIYGVYWFYKHWERQKNALRLDIWPIARGIFSIFFTHSLFKAIHLSARQQNLNPSWDPSTQATIYVVLVVVSRVVERATNLSTGIALNLVSMGLALSCLFPLISAQQVANTASGDPEARSNSKLTAGNIVWLLLGLAFWALVLVGIVMPEPTEPTGLEGFKGFDD